MPLPIIKSPVDVIGDNALNAAEAVVWPVPPDAMGNVPVVNADDDVAYTAPPDVNVVNPVPPYPVAIVVPFQTPVPIVPTLVKDEETTVLFKVVPESVPAGAITAAVDAAVN